MASESKSALPASPTPSTLQLARSASETSPPKPGSKKHRHHPHLHRREKDDRSSPFGAASNLYLATSQSFEAKSEGATPAGSRNGSGRNSIFAGEVGGPDGNAYWEVGMSGGGLGRRRAVKDAEVKEEKVRAALRATDLRNSMLDINTLANDATRRLDLTYYSILEKLSVLHNTISSMKELALLARQLNEDFDVETKEVIDEVETQMESFKGFQEQDDKIEKLEGRIKSGRERVKELGDRLEVVRARVEGWEKHEGEWKEKTKTRLRMLWLGIGFLVLAFVTLIMLPHISGPKAGMELVSGINSSNLGAKIPSLESLEDMAEEEVAKLSAAASNVVEELRNTHTHTHTRNLPVNDEPRLRLFDEL